jgi:hypothetical protein
VALPSFCNKLLFTTGVGYLLYDLHHGVMHWRHEIYLKFKCHCLSQHTKIHHVYKKTTMKETNLDTQKHPKQHTKQCLYKLQCINYFQPSTNLQYKWFVFIKELQIKKYTLQNMENNVISCTFGSIKHQTNMIVKRKKDPKDLTPSLFVSSGFNYYLLVKLHHS